MNKKSQYKKNIVQRPGRYNVRDVEVAFSYEKQSEDRRRLEKILKVPGKHSVYNALAALAAARALGIADEISFEALAEFHGTWRRFEEIGYYKGALVISDYAHNPAKIKALAEALICKMKREKNGGEAIIIFQPHHQKRLESLFNEFVEAFGDISKKFQVSSFKFQGIITDVYEVAGREIKSQPKVGSPRAEKIPAQGWSASGGKNSKTLVDAINKKYPDADVAYISRRELGKYLKYQISNTKYQILVFAGAGDIDNFARKILNTKY